MKNFGVEKYKLNNKKEAKRIIYNKRGKKKNKFLFIPIFHLTLAYKSKSKRSL
jgi:hypothetical protein